MKGTNDIACLEWYCLLKNTNTCVYPKIEKITHTLERSD